ncbi:MAG: hypothetical protein OHK0023_27490 [Anaerolineae bacterium]
MGFTGYDDESDVQFDAANTTFGFNPSSEKPKSTFIPERRFGPSDAVIAVLIVIIFGVGAYFRFVGQNWDDFTHLHPDERFLTQVAEAVGNAPLSLTLPDPQARAQVLDECRQKYPDRGGVGDFFDSRCTNWYPKNVGFGLYVYGELPLFIVRLSAELTQMIHLPIAQGTEDPLDDVVALNWTGYNGIHLVGRSVSAVADLLTLLMVFVLGRTLYGKWVGILAMALYAAAVFPIQLSHFWTTDAFTTLPVIMAIYYSVRAMRHGKLADFVLFGLFMGAAIASRINVLPLIGMILIAAVLYALPSFARQVPINVRSSIVTKAVFGLFIAILATLVSFRFLNPHAFVGGPGILGIFNIIPHQPFLDDLGQAQYLTSGRADFPPNHQWASRTPYLFPLRNMVIWGLGLPLGLMGWFGLIWALWQILRNRPGWTRHLIMAAWIVGYFAYMGRLWVMTMRYYMPLYPFLVIFAAWAMWEFGRLALRAAQTRPHLMRRLAFAASALLLIGVVAFTYLWAAGFTSIYRRQLTRVEASHWVTRNLPSAISVTLKTDDGRERLVNTPLGASNISATIINYTADERKVTPIPLTPSAKTFDRVIVNRLYDPTPDSGTKDFWVAIALDPEASQVAAIGRVQSDFSTSEGLGKPYTIVLDKPVTLTPSVTYYLTTWASDALMLVRLTLDEADFMLSDSQLNIASTVQIQPQNALDENLLSYDQATAFFSTAPLTTTFTAPLTGDIESVDIPHLLDPLASGRDIRVSVSIFDALTAQELGKGALSQNFSTTRTSPFGDAASIPLETSVRLIKDQQYQITIRTESEAFLRATGTVIATEGPWDDPVPQKVCALPAEMEIGQPIPSGLYNVAECRGMDPWGFTYKGLELYMSAEDDLQKRETLQKVLDETDYITISSNRFYDTLSRLPTRFPMSIAFYQALFKGELGFEVAAVFDSTFQIGDLKISDQHLPTYNGYEQTWLNEWESEEAFSVYDHPAVIILRKNPEKYKSEAVAQVLNAVPLNDSSQVSFQPEDTKIVNVIRWGAYEASRAPTAFKMDDQLARTQTEGGTWSELFNRHWFINSSELIAVIGWWLTIFIFGLIVFPILFAVFPGLPDRGYPFAKITGLLLVGWLAYVGGTMRLSVWNSGGILLIMVALAIISVIVAWSRRTEFIGFVRANWRHFLVIEAITLGLFLAFLVVRLGNPDLWAQTLGGEKPMNFAYFNATLRSTVFPAYDPWYAGGFLNYYYFGYVLVGTPVKLIGVMPSVAYNLIVPTLFAITGIGVFSLAFNLVAARWFLPRGEGDPSRTSRPAQRLAAALKVPAANPYLAGTLALLLCMVLGNLATPREFVRGVSNAAGCTVTTDLYLWKFNQFVAQNGRQPTADETLQLVNDSENPSITDQLSFGFATLGEQLDCLGRGLGRLFEGSFLPIGAERWYWGPRSVVGEISGSSNEINEFPYFTFVFGDLHAHMIALPLTLLAIAWVMAEVLIAGHASRATWVVVASTFLGGLTVGVLRATNTWDWITYLILGMIALPVVFIMRRERLDRVHLTAWAAQIGWFFAAQIIAAQPFMQYHATAYSSVKSFEGNKTPIWAYLLMHGTFIFPVVSLLFWQTSKVFRTVLIRDLIGKFWLVALVGAGVILTLGMAVFLSFVPIQVFLLDLPIPLALMLVPLLMWAVALFFVPGQTREGQIVLVLIGLALGISLGVEIVVLDGDIGRQNTFFKFYMQVWMMLSVASGVILAWLIASLPRWGSSARTGWLFALSALLSVAALFPIMSTVGKNAMRMAPDAPRTLDGNAYMEYATYYYGSDAVPMKNDLAMIRWLQDNVQGTPVILEAHQYPSEYQYNSRIAISTGLPAVIGWRFHQQQQRTLDPLPNLVVQRAANARAMYESLDIEVVWDMLRYYKVRYIILGGLERVTYTAGGLEKFDTMVELGLLKVVFEQDEDRIYEVIPGAVYVPKVVGMKTE